MNAFNPIVLRMVKTLWSFSHSECNRITKRVDCNILHVSLYVIFFFLPLTFRLSCKNPIRWAHEMVMQFQ